jgi:hypothetical protein
MERRKTLRTLTFAVAILTVSSCTEANHPDPGEPYQPGPGAAYPLGAPYQPGVACQPGIGVACRQP